MVFDAWGRRSARTLHPGSTGRSGTARKHFAHHPGTARSSHERTVAGRLPNSPSRRIARRAARTSRGATRANHRATRTNHRATRTNHRALGVGHREIGVGFGPAGVGRSTAGAPNSSDSQRDSSAVPSGGRTVNHRIKADFGRISRCPGVTKTRAREALDGGAGNIRFRPDRPV